MIKTKNHKKNLNNLKTKHNNNLNNNRGSSLVLLIIIISVIIFLGVSLMSITLINYQIKKTNSEIKQSFYMSEKGLNEAYSKAYDLMIYAANDSVVKAEEYLLVNPLDEAGAISLYSNNFKSLVTSQIKGKIISSSNPAITITNVSTLYFTGDVMTVSIQSKYTSAKNIEKTTGVNLVIEIPDYYEAIAGTIDYSVYLKFDKFKIIS